MKLKCLILLGSVLSIQAASVIREAIPVNVVYLEDSQNPQNLRERNHVRFLQTRNLDPKVQLSKEELKEADKHIPASTDTKNNESIFTKAKLIFDENLSNLRKNFENLSLRSGQKPTSEDWAKLNEKVNEVYKKYNENGVKQNQGTNFFSELQQAATNWFQSLGSNNNNVDKPEDEQSSGPGFGNMWNTFQQSVSQAFSNLANQGSTTSNTVLGDTEVSSTTPSTNGIQNFFNNIFNNNNGDQSSSTEGSNFFQGAINNLFSSFSGSTQSPGDTSTQNPGAQIFQNINNAFTGSTQSPDSSSQGSAFGVIDNFVTVFNIFKPTSTTPANIAFSESTSTSSSLGGGIQQIQNIGQQILGNAQSSTQNGNLGIIQQFQNASQQPLQIIAKPIEAFTILPSSQFGQIQQAAPQITGDNQLLQPNLTDNIGIIQQIQNASQQFGASQPFDQIQQAVQQVTGNNQFLQPNLTDNIGIIQQIQNASQQFGGQNSQPIDQIQQAVQQVTGNNQFLQPNLTDNIGIIQQIQNASQQFGGQNSQPIVQIQQIAGQITGNNQILQPSLTDNLGIIQQFQNASQQAGAFIPTAPPVLKNSEQLSDKFSSSQSEEKTNNNLLQQTITESNSLSPTNEGKNQPQKTSSPNEVSQPEKLSNVIEIQTEKFETSEKETQENKQKEK